MMSIKFPITITLLIVSLFSPSAFSRILSASYFVPVDDVELLPFATFSEPPRPTGVGTGYGVSPNTISFLMPERLLGEKKSFTLRRQANDQWAGNDVVGTCDLQEAQKIVCPLVFSNMQVDPRKVTALLQGQNLSADAIAKSLAVTALCQGECHGVLELIVTPEMANSFKNSSAY